MDSKKVSKLEKKFEIKPYSTIQLSEMYGVSRFIMGKWLKAIEDQLGPRRGWFYSTHQVKIIVAIYGTPGQIIDEAA